MLALESALSQAEMIKLRKRHEYGMLGRVKKGKFPGAIPWGWRKVYHADGPAIEIDEAAARVIRLIFQWYLEEGAGIRTIAEKLNQAGYVTPTGKQWGGQNVQAIFRKVWRYAGFAELNVNSNRPYLRVPGDWPSIIDEKTAVEVQQERERRSRARRAVSNTYLFSLCVYCAECGQRMRYSVTQRDSSSSYQRKALRCSNDEIPHRHRYISENKVRLAVEQGIQRLHDEGIEDIPEDNNQGERQIEEAIAAIQARIEHLRQALYRADDAYVMGRMNAERYQRQIERLSTQIAVQEEKQHQLEQQAQQESRGEQRRQHVQEVAELGLDMLHHDDIKIANAWLKRHIRIWVADCDVSHIEYL